MLTLECCECRKEFRTRAELKDHKCEVTLIVRLREREDDEDSLHYDTRTFKVQSLQARSK